MRGLVISWFFPPETSAEGLVTYKLLKYSRYEYDVYASNKAIWGYSAKSDCYHKNINSYLFKTSTFDVCKAMCYGLYKLKNDNYDFIMSRSMPPESHEIALKIKEDRPDLPWIASFGDPIAYNPYEITNVVHARKFIPNAMKRYMLNNPRTWINKLSYLGLKNNVLSRMVELEKKVFERADLLIFPNIQQCIYSLDVDYERYKPKCLIIPHSYDNDMIENINTNDKVEDDKFHFLYIGYLDNYRNPESIILAYDLLKKNNPSIAKKIVIDFVGAMPSKYKNMITLMDLYKNIILHPAVDYQTSLQLMLKADCMLHIDAKFSYKYNTNIFFASKLSDYMGCQKPILGITAKDSPAYDILTQSNNLVHEKEDIIGIADSMCKYVNHKVDINCDYYKKYDAKLISACFDDIVNRQFF